MKQPTPHEILGVARDATPEQIRRAYRSKAKSLHPDVNRAGDAAERFARLQHAYEVLTDPELRRKAASKQQPREEEPPGEAHFNWANIAGHSRRPRGAGDADPHGFEELYRAFFQSRIDQGGRSATQRRAGGASGAERDG